MIDNFHPIYFEFNQYRRDADAPQKIESDLSLGRKHH